MDNRSFDLVASRKIKVVHKIVYGNKVDAKSLGDLLQGLSQLVVPMVQFFTRNGCAHAGCIISVAVHSSTHRLLSRPDVARISLPR